MNAIQALAVTVLLALASPVSGAQPAAAQPPPSAEQANRALVAAFEAAWNAHDMQAFGRLLTADVDWINLDAGRGKGREQVQQGHVKVHAGNFKSSVMTVKAVDVALLGPEVGLVHIAWTIRGERNSDGSPRAPREGIYTWVTVKQASGWQIRAGQNTNTARTAKP